MMLALRRRIARPFRERAKAAQGRGQWSEALTHYQAVRRINPTNHAVLLPIANMQTELGRHAEAESTFFAAAEFAEYRLNALIGLAGVAERRGDWPVAISRWETVLTAMAQDEEARGATARSSWPLTPAAVLLQGALGRDVVGDSAGSERDLALAMALEPAIRRSAGASLLRGRSLARTDIRAAYGVLRAAYRRYPQDYSILFELTKAAIVAAERSQAEGFARTLLAMDPANEATRSMLRDRGVLAAAESKTPVG